MGVDMSLYVYAEPKDVLTHQMFTALVLELLHERLVAMPCALLEYEPEPALVPDEEYPLDLWDAARHPEYAPHGTIVRFHSDNEEGLAEVLGEMRFGQVDYYVCFDQLDWSNGELRESFEGLHYANARRVVIAALAQRHPIDVSDSVRGKSAMIKTAQYFHLYGKSGPQGVAHTPLENVLGRYFGSPLAVACGYF